MPKKKGAPASLFVPVEEQPYPIPENWCWVSLESIADGFQYGYTEKATYDKIGPHFIRITDIGDGIIDDANAPYCKIEDKVYLKYKIYKNDIFIARMGSVGENGIALKDVDGVFASYLIRIVPKISAQLMIAFFQSPMYWWQITDKSQGTTRLNINANVLKKLLFPLPPRLEQRRIVARVESLFSKLDAAKEKAQAIVDGFELRKSAVLHKAFTGELTEQWRKEHGVGLDSWKKCLIGDVFDLQAGKNISAKEISSQQTDLYRYPCFGGNGIRGYVEQFNREGEHPIIGRQGALCGNINLANNQFYATEHAVVVSYKMDVSTLWAYHYLKFLNLNQYATATAQPGLAVSNIVKVPIQYVPLEEQQELSQILDNLLNKEQQAKEAAEAVLSQIDTMKKAILARAFRGELGTNDPAEEWAGELVKKLLSEKT